MILGIDASRCRSGGAINHIKGILKHLDPDYFKIKVVHIWSYDKLLNEIHQTFPDIKLNIYSKDFF